VFKDALIIGTGNTASAEEVESILSLFKGFDDESLERASVVERLEEKAVEVVPCWRVAAELLGWRSYLALQEEEWAGRPVVLWKT
jgi:hypothetical protein